MTDTNPPKIDEQSMVVQMALLNNNLAHMKDAFEKQAKEQNLNVNGVSQKIDLLTEIIQKKADRSDLTSEISKLVVEREKLLVQVRTEIAECASQEDLDRLRVDHDKVSNRQDDYVEKKSLKPMLWGISIALAALLTGMGTEMWGGVSRAFFGG